MGGVGEFYPEALVFEAVVSLVRGDIDSNVMVFVCGPAREGEVVYQAVGPIIIAFQDFYFTVRVSGGGGEVSLF